MDIAYSHQLEIILQVSGIKSHILKLTNFWLTLESGINIGVRLLILRFFPRAKSFLKGATFIDFLFLKTFQFFLTFFSFGYV